MAGTALIPDEGTARCSSGIGDSTVPGETFGQCIQLGRRPWCRLEPEDTAVRSCAIPKRSNSVANNNGATVIRHGISFGSALAIAISWSVNKSILWAVVHGALSWIYVIYYALTR